MSQSTIELLPTEILRKIFLYISDNEYYQGQEVSIKNIRLVSKRIMEVSSTLLVRSAAVCLASQSFSRLEELCSHRHFNKSIKKVTINVAYYDVKLARNRKAYFEDCSSRLGYTLEIAERASGFARFNRDKGDPEKQKLYDLEDAKDAQAWRIEKELRRLGNSNEEIASPTDAQQILMNQHKEYVLRTNDQEELRINNNHIKRLCACLSQLPALEEIELVSRGHKSGGPWRYLQDDKVDAVPPPSGFYSFALEKQSWNGTFHTAYTTDPPVEMLGELLSQLGMANIRPRTITANLGVPADLKRLRVSEEQFKGIQQLVSKASTIKLSFNSLTRKGSLAENNDRSLAEMTALGSVVKALTSTPSLQTLSLRISEYPVFHEFPTANLSALLPIRSALWPNLQHLELDHVPVDLNELDRFVDVHGNSLRSFKTQSVFLRDGTWISALDILRRFNKLEEIQLRYWNGGEQQRGGIPSHKFPREEAEKYVMGTTLVNPLLPPPVGMEG